MRHGRSYLAHELLDGKAMSFSRPLGTNASELNGVCDGLVSMPACMNTQSHIIAHSDQIGTASVCTMKYRIFQIIYIHNVVFTYEIVSEQMNLS